MIEVLAPAVRYAEEGYPLSPMLAKMWERASERFAKEFAGKHEFDEWFKVFTKQGESYHCGEIVKLPDHAKTLRLIGNTDAKAFYEGEIAQQLVKQSKRDGGYFSLDDLKDYKASWLNRSV